MKKLLILLVFMLGILYCQDSYYDHNHNVFIQGWTMNDPTPYADSSATGRILTYTAGETLDFGDVCFLKSDGEMYLIDADAEATLPGKYMALQPITDGNDGKFLLNGWARNNSWSWTVGGMVYASLVGTTGNTMTQTRPTVADDLVQLLGLAFEAEVIEFTPNIMLIKLK